MTTTKSVSGVLGVCRVDIGNPTQVWPFNFAGLRAVCRVCWVLLRVRACVTLFVGESGPGISSHARTDKPNTPNTPNSKLIKILILKGFICVGFVLGMAFFVSGSIFGGMAR